LGKKKKKKNTSPFLVPGVRQILEKAFDIASYLIGKI